jgi:hypothetical protein
MVVSEVISAQKWPQKWLGLKSALRYCISLDCRNSIENTHQRGIIKGNLEQQPY